MCKSCLGESYEEKRIRKKEQKEREEAERKEQKEREEAEAKGPEPGLANGEIWKGKIFKNTGRNRHTKLCWPTISFKSDHIVVTQDGNNYKITDMTVDVNDPKILHFTLNYSYGECMEYKDRNEYTQYKFLEKTNFKCERYDWFIKVYSRSLAEDGRWYGSLNNGPTKFELHNSY